MTKDKSKDAILYDLEDYVDSVNTFELVGDGDIEKISSILGQSSNSNLLYVGKSGLGKTANLHGIAQRKKATIEATLGKDESRLPLHMIDRRYLLLDTNKLFSWNDPERIEQNLKSIIAELDKPGKHVLIIEDMNDWLRGIEDNQCQGMISTFVSLMKRGAFQMIGMVKDEPGKNSLGKVLEAHSEMSELFTVLEKKPPSKEEVLEIMAKSKGALEAHHDGLHITDAANEEIVNLTFLYPNLKHYMREQPARSLRMRDQIASTFVSRMQSRPPELTALEIEMGAVKKRITEEGEIPELMTSQTTLEMQIQDVRDEWDNRTHALGQAFLKKRTIEKQLQGYEQKLADEMKKLGDAFEKEQGRSATDKDLALIKTQQVKELESFCRQGRKDLEDADLATQKIKGENNTRLTLDVTEIREGFTELTSIPVKDQNTDEATKVLGLASRLKEKVYGQDDAIDTVSGAIRRAKAGLKDPKKPIGSFMVLGSSGIGKSYVAECLAEDLYGDSEALTVFDMSEYMEKQNISRLIGSTPGLVGYGEGGKLTNAVRKSPYQVILLDEIEKAHPDVFKILLQVMDKGRLSDELGTVDFRNVVLIMTTNLGQHLSFDAERTSKNSRDDIIGAARQIFPQELVNRVDDFLLFKALDNANVERIVKREMKGLSGTLAERKISIILPDADVTALVADKYKPVEGARQILKFIDNNMKDKVADIVLNNSQGKTGGDITVNYKPGDDKFDLVFTPGKKEEDPVPVAPAGAMSMSAASRVVFAPMFH